jgi:hypothetical protein
MFLFTLVSSTSIGDNYKVNEEMQITNYCQAGSCTYMNISSITYPNETILYLNSAMTKNEQSFNYSFTPDQVGTYYFITDGNPSVPIRDKDSFTVTYNGESNQDVAIYIFLLIFICSLIYGYHKLSEKINYDTWYKGILRKYEEKNYIKSNLSFIFYSLAKDAFLIYYSLVFIAILFLSDIIFMFNVISLIPIMEKVVMLYSFGIIAVAFMFIGKAQEMVMNLLEDIRNENWGMN